MNLRVTDCGCQGEDVPAHLRRSVWIDAEAVLHHVVQRQGLECLPLDEDLWLALFTRCPSPEGHALREPRAEHGYERQPMPLTITRARAQQGDWVNAEEHVFRPEGGAWERVDWAGVIDARGGCLMTARVRTPLRTTPSPLAGVRFAPGSIRLSPTPRPRS